MIRSEAGAVLIETSVPFIKNKNMVAVSLFWDTNFASVMSCVNPP